MAPNFDDARKGARIFLSLLPLAANAGREAYTYEAFGRADARLDPVRAGSVVEAARRGDRELRLAVHTMIAWLAVNREPIVEPLLGYLLDLLNSGGERKRGRNAHENYLRNHLIAQAVAVVVSHGFHRTRNPSTKDKGGGPSACSIVAEMLAEMKIDIGEKAVEDISA